MGKHVFTKDEVRQMVKDEDIHFLRVMFTDLLGTIKSVDLPVSQLDKLMDLFGLKKVTCIFTQICPLGLHSLGVLNTGRLRG